MGSLLDELRAEATANGIRKDLLPGLGQTKEELDEDRRKVLELMTPEHQEEIRKTYQKKVKKAITPPLPPGLITKAQEMLKDPNLIRYIHAELDKYHKRDHKEKLAVWLIGLSGFLPNPSDHCSVALKGNSSAGKDNAIRTALKHLPQNASFFLTRGTQSSLEEEAAKVAIIAFSEMNADREAGANKELTELFKQLSEGGVRVIKRDKTTNQIIHLETVQKSLMYSTTEAQSDEELQTRYVIIPISSDETKNKIVVDDYLNNISDPARYYALIKNYNWVQLAVEHLDRELDVLIPYAPLLTQPFKNSKGEDTYLFDMRKERVKRDVKRLMSLTKAIAWLYQKQRRIKEADDHKFIVATPQDFKLAFYLFMEFFDLTYTGIDYRVLDVYRKIQELEGCHATDIQKLGYGLDYASYVLRHKVQEACGIGSKNTIKEYIKELVDKGLIEGFYLASIPKGYLLKTNRVSIGYQQAIRGYQLDTLDTLLTPYFDTLEKEDLSLGQKERADFEAFNHLLAVFFDQLTPTKLTPSKVQEDTPIKKINALLNKALDNHKEGLELGLWYANLKAAGYNLNEVDAEVQRWKDQGLAFETRPGVLRRLE